MNSEWYTFTRKFDSVFCQRIIDECLKNPLVPGAVRVANEVDNAIRNSKVNFFTADQSPFFSYIFDEVWKMVLKCNDDCFNFHLTRMPSIQFSEYSADNFSEYKQHVDTFWLSKTQYHRKLSCVIQLSDPNSYAGGDFELYGLEGMYPDRLDLRQQGTAIFFPSFITHAALPVTMGVRYSLAVWIEGPKWR
jgi:PKHD-type hydroxylase